ncbi:MAG TPA: gamma-glutamyl-gamma-aminobutyrate hydrolase family protein [Pirellulales bacterium]|jgi:GMP synthase (glutamine-hydrolysing)|nr:gamma-glutamyl-gamma-aminobutyrate hydrolase family protein [Pirellulales bacterium]
MKPAARVIVLQHVGCETLGAIEQVLQQAGIGFDYVRTFAGVPVPPTLDEASGLIIMGGPMSVYEEDQYPYLAEERRLIESALALGKPVLGVCLGSQLLAHVLGAKVYPGRRKEIGWYPVTLSRAAAGDAIFADAPPTFAAYHWHGDVFDLPASCELLASSALTPHQAFRYGANAYGVLFHMEVTRELIETMTDSFANELRQVGQSGAQIRQQADDLLPPLARIGQTVFGRWAAQLAPGIPAS